MSNYVDWFDGTVLKRMGKYADERNKLRGYADEIHGLNAGHEREAYLKFSDLETSMRITKDLYDALQLVVGSLEFDREDETNAEVLRRVKVAIAAADR